MIFKINMINQNKQFLILTYWHIGSWKTTLAKIIEKEFNINRINNDYIRDYMKNNILCYKNTDISSRTTTTTEMNQSVRKIRDIIIKDLISLGQSIIIDAWNIKKSIRNRIINFKVHATKNIETIIIKFNIKEEELLARLEQRDVTSKRKTKRTEFYITKKKTEIEKLQLNESDHIIEFNQNNLEETLENLKNIFK